uniref:Putative YopX protein n=1 Tax=viral metagenome TaxID=1070528 RepID=A0A6M3KJG8_9ZZZZ
MREIKFRAWDKEKKQILVPLACVFHFSIDGFQGVEYHGGGHVIFLQKNHVELMQCTGLKDKNGKEIYEGDIINEGVIKNKIVSWFPGQCCFNIGYYHPEAQKRHEILGNIYENPELIKG